MTCAALLLASPAVATVNVWFMPGTTGSGGAKGSPRAFDWVSLTSQELSPSATDKDVVLHFMSSGGPVPTIHLNVFMGDGFLGSTDPTGTGLAQWSLRIVGGEKPGNGIGVARPEETVLMLPDHHPAGAGQDDNGFAQAGILSFATRSLGSGKELNRLVVENLTLDCNWSGQDYRNAASTWVDPVGPQYPRSYKSFGAHLSARTGRVSKVIVRNYGSHGLVPQSIYDNSGGIETFPLTVETTDVGQEPYPGDPRPWVGVRLEVAVRRGGWRVR